MTFSASAVIWLVSGFGLIAVEFFAPHLILVFIGIAAVATGIAVAIGIPIGLGAQVFLFAVLAAALLLGLRRTARRVFKGMTADIADREPGFDEFLGREAVAVDGFREGGFDGRVNFRGTDWNARASGPISVGDRVRIIGRNGQNLKIEKAPL